MAQAQRRARKEVKISSRCRNNIILVEYFKEYKALGCLNYVQLVMCVLCTYKMTFCVTRIPEKNKNCVHKCDGKKNRGKEKIES